MYRALCAEMTEGVVSRLPRESVEALNALGLRLIVPLFALADLFSFSGKIECSRNDAFGELCCGGFMGDG